MTKRSARAWLGLVASILLTAAAVGGLRATTTRQQPVLHGPESNSLGRLTTRAVPVGGPLLAPSSEHACVGADSSNASWVRTTCAFQHVCYAPAVQQFLYFSSRAVPLAELEVALSPAADAERFPDGPNRLRFTVVDPSSALARQLLEGKTVVTFSDLFMTYTSYLASNFGHFLGDELLPAFRAMRMFDALSDRVHMLRVRVTNPWRFGWTCDWHAALNESGQNADFYGARIVKRCEKNYRKLMPLLTDAPALVLNDTMNDTGRVYCFESMLAGEGFLSDHCMDVDEHGRYPERLANASSACNHAAAPILWEFRAHCLRRMGIEPSAPLEQRRGLLVLFSNSSAEPKDGASPRSYTGYSDIAAAVSARFSGAVVGGRRVRVEVVEMASLSLKEQLALSSEAAVLITTSGGGSFNLLFQPRWATALVFAGNGPEYDKEFYVQLSHVSVQYVRHSPAQVEEALAVVDHGLTRYSSMQSFGKQ